MEASKEETPKATEEKKEVEGKKYDGGDIPKSSSSEKKKD